MADFFRRHSLFLTSLALVICSFQLMSASVRNHEIPRLGATVMLRALQPFEALHHNVSSGIGGWWDHYVWLMDVEAEHGENSKRIKVLEAQNSRFIEYENENLRLRKLLQFANSAVYESVAADVVGRDPSNWVRTVSINHGSNEGIRPGFPVVDGHAVVGQTTVVTSNRSKVLLLTDSSSAIDAIVQRSRAPGVVEGTGRNWLEMRYVRKEDDVKIGDRIISSGLDGVFPKGTLIGAVTAVDSDVTGLFQNVRLEPSVPLHKLESVLVLKSTKPRRLVSSPVAAEAKQPKVNASQQTADAKEQS